jgi:hypothetical protein
MQPQPSQEKAPEGILMSLLCLALYRNGGEIVLDNLDELKESMFLPTLEPVRDGVVKLTVSKYTKQPAQQAEKAKKRRERSK